ncbi:MAG: motility protein A [Desulfovibrionales bacterium]
MNFKTFAGILLCFLLFISSFLLSGNAGVYFNLTALLVVFSGTAGAALLSSGLGRMKDALFLARQAYSRENGSATLLIAEILRVSLFIRKKGYLHPSDRKKVRNPILASGLELLEDNFDPEEIEQALSSEMRMLAWRRERIENVFRNMASFAPSFGVAGSVIGLIGLLTGLGDTALILKNIPVALVSTLYGVVLANFFLTPIAERIQDDTQTQILSREIVLEGMISISAGTEFHKLNCKLNMLVRPEERIEDRTLIRKIKSSVFSVKSAPAST